MTEQIHDTSDPYIIDLLNKALENPAYILFGIGFIFLCIFVGLLNRKARKADPEKYARSTGTVVINGQSHSVTRAGNTTYID